MTGVLFCSLCASVFVTSYVFFFFMKDAPHWTSIALLNFYCTVEYHYQQPFTAIIKLGRARTFFKITLRFFIRLKEERHIHLGWLGGE